MRIVKRDTVEAEIGFPFDLQFPGEQGAVQSW